MASGNPALNERVFRAVRGDTTSGIMTLDGTVAKTSLLVVILLATAAFSWSQTSAAMQSSPDASPTWLRWLLPALIAGTIVAFVTIFVPRWSPVTAPIYAALQGIFLGAISAVFEVAYQGIVAQAVALTMGVLILMLAAYATRIIRATEKFKLGVVCATGAIALVYLVTMVLRWFDVGVPFIHDSGPIGILFSLFVVGIAALNLILDFDFIETGVREGAPKFMEWYGGFGLLVTLVWLYLEILRLLAKLRGGRD
jgi:uncharacterized YccA/Bax inhibitor family protein